MESGILLDIIAGPTSSLYEELLKDNLINTTFDTEYFEGYGYSAHIFNGESKDPVAVRERINAEITRVMNDGVDREAFQRIKKKHYGSLIMDFDSIDSISNSLISAYFNNEGLYDQLKLLESITAEDIDNRLKNAFNIENSSMSVIK